MWTPGGKLCCYGHFQGVFFAEKDTGENTLSARKADRKSDYFLAWIEDREVWVHDPFYRPQSR